MKEDCSKISCPVPKNQVQDYLNQYSLNQTVISNTEYTAVINGIPITIPAGTFSYPITQNSTIFPNLTFRGCQSLITVPIPNGSSFSQIQSLVQGMMQQAAAQQAECNAQRASPSPPPVPSFFNNQSVFDPSCENGGEFIITSPLPNGISRNGQLVVLAAGIVPSNISQADADNQANSALNAYINGLLLSGNAMCVWWNTEQVVTCWDGTKQTIPVHTYFSLQSVDDANATAIQVALGQCQDGGHGQPDPPCPDLTSGWTGGVSGGAGSSITVNSSSGNAVLTSIAGNAVGGSFAHPAYNVYQDEGCPFSIRIWGTIEVGAFNTIPYYDSGNQETVMSCLSIYASSCITGADLLNIHQIQATPQSFDVTKNITLPKFNGCNMNISFGITAAALDSNTKITINFQVL